MNWDLISSYTGLLVLASGSVYAGSFGSLPNPKRQPGSQETETKEDDEDEIIEHLTSSDAWMFPVLGSIVLFSLYLIIKYLGKEWINVILQWYTSITGVGSVWKASISLTRFLLGNEQWKRRQTYRFSVRKGETEKAWSIACKSPTLYLLPFSMLPSLLYNFTGAGRRSAILSNVLALSFCYSGMAFIRLDSFVTGCVLLSGLFVYDIWWVFGTEVMIKVATTLDVPIKLLWPKSMVFSSANGYTMLGLGDVVIPGTFIALALRYDYEHRKKGSDAGRSFSKPYFSASLAGYVAALATTMFVMHVFKRGQPALLYISPACIGAFLLTATVRGELQEAWAWTDEAAAARDGEKKKDE